MEIEDQKIVGKSDFFTKVTTQAVHKIVRFIQKWKRNSYFQLLVCKKSK